MKAKLLKKLRRKGRAKIELISIELSNDNYIIGVSYYREVNIYKGLVDYVCFRKYEGFYKTEKILADEAAKIYVRKWLNAYRDSYRIKNPKKNI